ncbi:aquaporin-4-like [Hydractinia symbiolongicarpus]|uniref:aquaporin-4-like n=1 Tax=Hydractinia symbiolongicarpus TaxID=13093 RepID=UPI00254ED10D|nr:aquaporin-4-like [Hydractinia symbiolongicarpus]
MARGSLSVSVNSGDVSENTALISSKKCNRKQRSILHELTKINFWKGVILEFLSTLLSVMNTCGSTLSLYEPGTGDLYPVPSHITVAICAGWGAIVLVAIGRHEKGYFNPAITFGLCVARKISVLRCILYMIAQTAGGIAGAALLFAFSKEKIRGNLGAVILHRDVPAYVGCIIEMILVFLIVVTVLTTIDPKNEFTGMSSPLAIGFASAVGMLMAYPYTGAALNPARALAPGLLMNQLNGQWLYWVGPMVGAVLAVFAYKYLFTMSEENDDDEDNNEYMKIDSSEV